LSDHRIEDLPHSVSSIHWGGKHRFSGNGARLILNVLESSEDAYDRNARYESFEIDLATGAVLDRERSGPFISLFAGGAIILLGIGAVGLIGRRHRSVGRSQ
jgi:hypothetical protein